MVKFLDRSVVIIIPALNEAETVGRVVREIKSEIPVHVVVVDDASTDNTASAALQAGAIVLPLTIRLGAWGAIRTGLRFADQNGYDYAVTMDADGQHPAQSLNHMLRELDGNDADMLIGSCSQRGSYARKIAWYFLRKLTMLGIEDLTSGFRVYNRRAIASLVSTRTILLDYQDIGVLLHLRKKGLKISEMPVPMCPRVCGQSKIFSSWWAVFRYLIITGILSVSKI